MNSKSVSQIDVRATNYKNQFCTIKELKENEKINKCKHTFSSLKMGIFCENKVHCCKSYVKLIQRVRNSI